MKYGISLFLGMLTGALMFVLGQYYNPFLGQASVSPLAVTDEQVMDLSFSAVPAESILFTNHGETNIAPHPERVAELWESPVNDTSVFVTTLADSRGNTTGIGIKMLSKSEQTALLRGEAIANSVWHVYLPGRGTMLIDQTENFWSYLRDVVIPARWSSGDNWRGSYFRVMTNGRGSLGTARVTGGSGYFSGVTTESVESLNAAGYSAATGPVAMQGNLTVAIPQQVAAQE